MRRVWVFFLFLALLVGCGFRRASVRIRGDYVYYKEMEIMSQPRYNNEIWRKRRYRIDSGNVLHIRQPNRKRTRVVVRNRRRLILTGYYVHDTVMMDNTPQVRGIDYSIGEYMLPLKDGEWVYYDGRGKVVRREMWDRGVMR